jgi:peptide-methionine (S)-S-oxide reductase
LSKINKIGFGGGCHWCTEAVFQSLKGVSNVEQGWIASEGESEAFSEAVIVEYNSIEIPLRILIEIHLHTHKSTSAHSMRKKYRSAIYFFEEEAESKINSIVYDLQAVFDNKLITQILPYKEFKPSNENIKNYYYKNPKKPFCKTYINPKLRLLLDFYPKYANKNRIGELE